MAAATQKVNRVQGWSKTKYTEEKKNHQNVILKPMHMCNWEKPAKEVQRREEKHDKEVHDVLGKKTNK